LSIAGPSQGFPLSQQKRLFGWAYCWENLLSKKEGGGGVLTDVYGNPLDEINAFHFGINVPLSKFSKNNNILH